VSALPYLKEGFRIVIRHVHRVSYCIFAPTLLALCYVRVNRPLAALIPLALAWVNQIFAARLLLPKTTYVTGELLYRNGLLLLGRWICQKGIQKANQLRLPAMLFELRLNFADLIVDADPEYAMILFRMCREYFSERQFLFLVDKCDRGIMRAQLNTESEQARASLRSGHSRSHDSITPGQQLKNSKSEFIRNRIEIESLLQVFLNLSSLNERAPLYDAVLDAMCNCTGVDFGVLFIYEDSKLIPVRARGCTLDELGQALNPAFGVDKWFLEKCEQENKREPRIRPSAWRTPHAACDGSAMVVPLPYKEKNYGFCYLANQGVNNYFDARSQRVVTPLAAQAAIAYQNLIFATAKEEKARLDAELTAARTVQDALLPSRIEVPNTKISYFYESASQTGGDWFHHHYDSTHNRLYVFVGDVTGHGLPSAMLTAVVSGAIQSHIRREFNLKDKNSLTLEESLRELAEIANFAVFWAGTRSNRYMTMSFSCLDLVTGEFGVVNAGHTPPYILNAMSNRVSALPCSGSLLGFSETASFGYATQTLQLGDSVLMYTDGLIENSVDEKPIMSPRSLRKIMETEKDPQKCVDNLAANISRALKVTELEDDITIYMLRWDGAVGQRLPEAS
jgi:serine phosphatase RsbU (regulator of sigma subunit)